MNKINDFDMKYTNFIFSNSFRLFSILLMGIMLSAGENLYAQATDIVTYAAPEGAKLNDTYSVMVRQNNGDWQLVPSYNVMVDEVAGTNHNVRNCSMAYFDFAGTVDVKVIYNKGTVDKAQVRPLSYDIKHSVNGNEITFQLDCSQNLSIEVNGDIFNNLQLFANPIDTYRPTSKDLKRLKKDSNYIYFAPGYHKIDRLTVGTNQTVYVSGGAIVDGEIVVDHADNAKVLGRGMIYPYRKKGLIVSHSSNVKIDGIFTTQTTVSDSHDVSLNNVKVMSYYGWGDGFNVFSSTNVAYTHVFARTSDDCSSIYASRGEHHGGCRNIMMEDAVLWADVAHPFTVGLHGDAKRPDTIEDLFYKNVDVLDMKEKQIDYQGVFAIIAGDNNTVRNVTFENIRIENFREGKLFDIRVANNKKYCAAPGLAIENINFNNISYNGDRAELSLIIGYNESRKVKGVHFKNLVINGEVIYDKMPGKPGWYKTSDMASIFIGEHVEDVTFEK